MTVRRVIIAGGGVAGAATALALQQAGIAAEIFEAHATGGDDAGAFLTVMRNGMAALDEIGATAAVEGVSFPARAVTLFGMGRRPIDGAARSMTRAALYRALQELSTTRGIPVHHGKRLTGATVENDQVVATFADGSTATGDILVGADGLHSRARRLIDPTAPEPRHAGQHVIYGYAPGNPAGAEPDEYTMIRGSRAFFGFTVPDGDGRTWWFARVDADRRADGGWSVTDRWRDLALEMFRDDPSPAASIITATKDAVGGDSYDIPTTPRWHDGHIVLTGDAAHATTPAAAQGASMALEDAVALATALRTHSEPAAAFADYEQRRRAQTEETVAASARLTTGGKPVAAESADV